MSKLRESLKIVCHQTRSPGNLGAIARLMANFGFRRLVLSDPVDFFSFGDAQKMAVGAQDILKSVYVVPTLEEALNDVVFACGTTSRSELKGRHALTPEEGAERLHHHSARGPVALVLGGEQRGLSDAELSRCQEVLVIPTEDTQPSMNLAQSAAVLLYLVAGVAGSASPARKEEAQELSHGDGARLQTIGALEQVMKATLIESGFLNPQNPDKVLVELTRSLLRGELNQREAELWLAAFKQLARE